MIYMISGQSGSAKSFLAEKIMSSFDGVRYYIATMQVYDEEGKQRVLRHRNMRRNKGFQTIEQSTKLNGIQVPKEASVLVECMSNLLANEMFPVNESPDERIIEDINELSKRVKNLVIVTNEVFSDGESYDEWTLEYISKLGRINQAVAKLSDVVVESVYGIPVYYKKKEGMVTL